MTEQSLTTARVVSSVAATLISLACGTNYVYSAWSPQFADKLKLSSTEINLIGLSGNLGMYSLGIPVGILVDRKGPRLAVIIGFVLLAAGYFPLHQAYDKGFGSIPLLCFFSYLTGLGGCAAFAAAIKTSALNWPHHRGTATGIPLAGFGLSAFFFSMFAQFVFTGDTGHFLLLLATGTSGLVFVSFFFLRVLPHPHYSAVATTDTLRRSDSNALSRTKSEDSKHRAGRVTVEPGDEVPEIVPCAETDETSSLMSKDSFSTPGDVSEENVVAKDRSHRVDIRGLRMCGLAEFWLLFVSMGILTGIGLMTINNIGNDANALWRHYDDSVSEEFITKRQALHVSILSVGSFVGRLVSGVGSDFLVKVLHASRIWCIVIASLVFLIAQLFALSTTNPHFLVAVSSLTGLGYGFLFGVYPSIIAEAFGVHGLSQNWGCMTLAPVVTGNLFNIIYGKVFDKHSIVLPGGERECTEGLACYRSAYSVTVIASIVGLVVSLWAIRFTNVQRRKEDLLRQLEDREA
ncbi:major facilitator superfamily transporter [Phlyctema vagabunda]|uniref:Major facilitator superfamily transporter n=1 Tax=Phlyctema vagabunda TaxID=108571 RepID=A0ABR4P4W2_9HELO